jgi:Ca-activated chloride channel family protein
LQQQWPAQLLAKTNQTKTNQTKEANQ